MCPSVCQDGKAAQANLHCDGGIALDCDETMMLDHQLDTLEGSGLIRQAATLSELEYLFRHALIQDAANASLLKADRRQLHRVVGEVLEDMYPQQLGLLAPSLARHFAEAGEAERALKYFTMAGEAAARQYANAEAVGYFSNAIALARQAPGAQAARLLSLYLGRGRALELDARDEEALANYEELERLGCEQHERAAELAALIARATIYGSAREVRNPALAQTLSDDALVLARALNDRAAEAKILWNLMHNVRDTGQFQESVQYGERSLAIARELNLREQLTYTLHDLSLSYMFIMQLDRAQEARLEAMALWRELNNLPMLAEDLSYTAVQNTLYGEFAEALEHATEALSISRQLANVWGQAMSLMPSALAYMELGQIDAAVEAMQEGIRLGAQAGFVPPQAQLSADLARIYGSMGNIAQGLAFGRLSLQKTENFPVYRLYALGALAIVQLMAGQIAEAAALVEAGLPELEQADVFPMSRFALTIAAVELALAQHEHGRALHLTEVLGGPLREFRLKLYSPHVLLLRALALHALGRVDEAWEQLQAALAESRAVNGRWGLWQSLELGSALEAQRGHMGEAQRLRAEAAAVIQYIAEHATGSGLRESFLDLPRVRAIIDAD